MKKILLTLVAILTFSMAAFSIEDNGMPTLDFAKQVGELIGMANLCGIDTADMNQQFIQGISVLATYRKENVQNAINVYQAYIQQQKLPAGTSCSQVRSDFEQVKAKMPKLN